jgi:hypothetical protein
MRMLHTSVACIVVYTPLVQKRTERNLVHIEKRVQQVVSRPKTLCALSPAVVPMIGLVTWTLWTPNVPNA